MPGNSAELKQIKGYGGGMIVGRRKSNEEGAATTIRAANGDAQNRPIGTKLQTFASCQIQANLSINKLDLDPNIMVT